MVDSDTWSNLMIGCETLDPLRATPWGVMVNWLQTEGCDLTIDADDLGKAIDYKLPALAAQRPVRILQKPKVMKFLERLFKITKAYRKTMIRN